MYSLIIEQKARKTLKKLPKSTRLKINNSIMGLKTNPRPFGYKKLTNSNFFRIRIGDYRVIYSINEREVKVFIINIGHRKDIYKYLR